MTLLRGGFCCQTQALGLLGLTLLFKRKRCFLCLPLFFGLTLLRGGFCCQTQALGLLGLTLLLKRKRASCAFRSSSA